MKAKKLLCLVLALIMLSSVFAGTAAAEKPYKLYYMYIVAGEGPNQKKVNDAVHELVLNELNMDITLIPMTFGTYMAQLPLMLASGEDLDVFPCFSNNFATYIDSMYIENLNDYLPQLQDAKAILGDDFECATVGDFLAGTSQMKERAYPAGFVVRKDIFDELGFKVEDFNVTTDDYSSFDQITEMFAKVKEKYPDMTMFDGGSIMALQTATYVDSLDTIFGGVLENYGQTTTVTNWFESEQYKTFCHIAKDWFDAGYVSKDIAVNTDSQELKLKAGNTFATMMNVKPNTDIEKLAQTGYEVVVIPCSLGMKATNSVNSVVFSIASSSKDPAKAAEFLNWSYTSREFNDLINWGIEGEDWIEDENGMATYPEGVDASNVGYHNDYGWIYPNQFVGHAWAGNPVDIWEQYAVYNDNLLVSQSFGFTFDPTPVANEIAQMQSVYDQYYKDIGFGVVPNLDEKIQEFNDALYAAGLQTVMDEKQAQLDAWLASK